MHLNVDQEPVFLTLDTQFKVTGINKAGCKLLGYGASEIIGNDWFERFMPQEHALHLKTLYSNLMGLNGGRSGWYEKAVKTRSGALHLVRWYSSFLIDTNGNVTGSVNMGTPVKHENGQTATPMVQNEQVKRKLVLSAALEAQEKERRMIAEQLHENITQILTTCKLLLENNGHSGALPQIEQAIRYLQQVINQVRRLSHWLNPEQLSEIGLEASLREMIQELCPSGKPHITLNINNAAALRHLHPDVQLSIFRMIQEQGSNIVNHAHATKAQVDIYLESDSVTLEISDNGRGFDLQTTPFGLGLRNIKSRAEHYEGKMHLDTVPGRGCTVLVRLPLS